MSEVTRRHFLQLLGGGALWFTARPRLGPPAAYAVGVGKSPDAYLATRRAVDASGEWSLLPVSGRKVVIKPNLVFPLAADTGTTTDPEVVRALVDMALESGAAQVLVVDGGPDGPNFSACGYDFFAGYDPLGRVTLVDLGIEPVVLARVPRGGMAYKKLYIPESVLANDVLFISAAKMKTHFHTHATLSMKNLVGLPPAERYRVAPDAWRFELHHRGINQAIVDLNLVRPIDFAVVDGVVGMEGEGPVGGTPVTMDMVVAGRNPVAVDRVCLQAMVIPQRGVHYLAYASRKGLGPADVSEIDVRGDPFTPRSFIWPVDLPPMVEYPRVSPPAFAPAPGRRALISYWVTGPCQTRVEIVLTSETSPEVTPIRTLHDWEQRPAGRETVGWDGRNDDGQVVPAARYTARVLAKYHDLGTEAYASGWVRVSHGAV